MGKNIKIDFYRVIVRSNAGITFDRILTNSSTMANDKTRNVTRFDHPYRLQDIKKEDNQWYGDIIRIRMNDLPLKASLDGNISNLGLNDDEGIGEETAFLYDVNTEVLLVQRNRFGVSAATLAFYFETISKSDEIELLPVVQQNALKILAKMQVQRKIEISFAGASNWKAYANQTEAVTNVLDAATYHEAPLATIILSMGRYKGTLSYIYELAKNVFKISTENPDSVRKLRVTGKTDEEEPNEVLDLLEYRMIDERNITFDQNRRLSKQDRLKALKDAWSYRKPELYQMFKE